MASTGPVPAIDSVEADRRVRESGDDGPVIVDVREQNEWDDVRIPGATLVPLSRIADDYSKLPHGRPLILQCASGKRSLVAAEFLRRNGYADVSNLVDGIKGWQGAGLPVERG